MLTPIDQVRLEEEMIIIRVALAAEFYWDPFSPCTRELRLMDVLLESQLTQITLKRRQEPQSPALSIPYASSTQETLMFFKQSLGL